MTRILVVNDEAAAAEILALPGWRARVEQVSHETVDALARRYHVVLRADHLDTAPLFSPDTRVALLCTELAAFERLEKLATTADVIFEPSPVARLDMLGAGRATLRTARALKRGAVLAATDLATENGGHGLGAGLIDRVVGRRVVYDLAEGAPLDFGMLGEAKDRS